MQPVTPSSKPLTGLPGLRQNWKSDLTAGFLVFLIALPLCLGIAMASGFPPVAGLFTAMVGGLLVSFAGGSQLTIKGPAAGLIVITLGAVTELGEGDAMLGYKLTLAVIVVAGLVQILFGLLRTGLLADLFPSAAVHGMLAAIGITIAVKQMYTLLGLQAVSGESLELIADLPLAVTQLNPEIALIGIISLAILVVLPLMKHPQIRKIPAPLLVVLAAMAMGRYFDLAHEHTYLFLDGHAYSIGPKFLVTLPHNLAEAIVFPDFSKLLSPVSLKYVAMFALVGSLESLVSNKAIDTLDPWHRKSNMNRDLLGVGAGNTLVGLIGGLPMISEIVRSSANVSNGGRTHWSNFFHGGFVLIFALFFPGLLHQIPLAALAALLVYTGYRLASPRSFYHVLKVGPGQLAIFLTTLAVTLVSDLLVGLAAGISLKLILHYVHGLPLRNTLKPHFDLEVNGDTYTLSLHQTAVFCNYLGIKNALEKIPSGKTIVFDLHDASLIDHTVMEYLTQFQRDYGLTGGTFSITGRGNLERQGADRTSALMVRKRKKHMHT